MTKDIQQDQDWAEHKMYVVSTLEDIKTEVKAIKRENKEDFASVRQEIGGLKVTTAKHATMWSLLVAFGSKLLGSITT